MWSAALQEPAPKTPEDMKLITQVWDSVICGEVR